MSANVDPEIGIMYSIRDIDKTSWDRLTTDQVYGRYGWLRTIEATVAEAASPLYFLMGREGRLAMSAVCYRLDEGAGRLMLDRMVYGRLAPLCTKLRISLCPALMCGPIIGQGRCVFWESGLEPEQLGRYLSKLLSEIEHYANSERLSIVYSKLPLEDSEVLESVAERIRSRTTNPPVSAMDITWSDFADYASSLSGNGKNMPNKVRREAAAPAKNGMTVSMCADVDELSKDVFQLIRSNRMRHSSAADRYAEDFFDHLLGTHDDSSILTLARSGESLEGAALLLVAGTNAAGPLIGVRDNERNRRAFTYFNLAVYEPVRFCIGHGIRKLYLGASSYDLKRRRGCHELELAMFLQCRTLLGRVAMRVWCRVHRAWTTRSLRREGVIPSANRT